MVTIDTELFHILYIDHAGGMVMSGTGHIANLGPGVGGRVKLENSGQGVVTIVSPLVRMDELRMQSNGLMVEILCEIFTCTNDLVVDGDSSHIFHSTRQRFSLSPGGVSLN